MESISEENGPPTAKSRIPPLQRLRGQLLTSCAPITLTSSNSVDHRGTEASDLEAQPVSGVRDLYGPAGRGERRH